MSQFTEQTRLETRVLLPGSYSVRGRNGVSGTSASSISLFMEPRYSKKRSVVYADRERNLVIPRQKKKKWKKKERKKSWATRKITTATSRSQRFLTQPRSRWTRRISISGRGDGSQQVRGSLDELGGSCAENARPKVGGCLDESEETIKQTDRQADGTDRQTGSEEDGTAELVIDFGGAPSRGRSGRGRWKTR